MDTPIRISGPASGRWTLIALIVAMVVTTGTVAARGAAPVIAAGAVVEVSKVAGLDPAGETVTVTGSGFDPAGNLGTRPPLAGQPGGVYVVFGRFADVWRPSESAPSSARQVISQKWVLPQSSHDALNPSGTDSAFALMGADGSFSIELDVEPGLDSGNYGVYVYPGSGATNAAEELAVSLSFASTGPVDPEPVDPDPVDPGPVDPDPVDPDPVDPGPVDPAPIDPAPVDPGPDAPAALTPLTPARLLDTRAGGTTVDGLFAATGTRAAGSILELDIAGRAGVPVDADAVVVNVTATGALAPGYVTAWPCGVARPEASALNVSGGGTVAAAVVTGLGPSGQLCLYTDTSTDLIVDVSAVGADGLVAVPPVRRLDSRVAGEPVVDVVEVDLGAVPSDAAAVALTVTATEASAAGFATVWACDEPMPVASNVNVASGATMANAVISAVSSTGTVCVYTAMPTHLLVDVTGWWVTGSTMDPVRPSRLVDTRAGASTIDGAQLGAGRLAVGSTTVVEVAGRGPVPLDAGTVVLNVTAVDTTVAGFVSVYPCTSAGSTTSTLNVDVGDTSANLVVAGLGVDGDICVTTTADAHLLVDVVATVG